MQWNYIRNYGLTSYVGKTWQGVKITDSGMLAAAHLVGAGALSNGIKNNTVPSDANGTKANNYMSWISGYNVTYIK